MENRLWARWTAFVRRVRRFERRELGTFRAWIEQTDTLVHLSALLFVTILVGLITYLLNTLEIISFLLFPPLASGTYTLFSDPRGTFASPTRFVAGLTIGSLCGWLALMLSTVVVPQAQTGQTSASVVSAAVAVLLTGTVTWLFDVEEPAAYSTALLALLVPLETQSAFVASIALSSTLIASVFSIWRSKFYEQRADIFYQSTSGDDHVLVPLRGERAGETALLAARLAGAHDAGKVVLLDIVDEADVARAERAMLDETEGSAVRMPEADGDGTSRTAPDPTGSAGTDQHQSTSVMEAAVAETAHTLEERARDIESAVDVACEVVVAVDGENEAATILQTARSENCDLIAVPHRDRSKSVDPYVSDLFASDVDVFVHRSTHGRTDWHQIMVPVRKTGDVAHSMVDFALRLANDVGSISVCNCIETSAERRSADAMLADLVEPFDGQIETRIARSPIQEFLETHADQYDLVMVGASQDRSTASRLISPPTFERLDDVETDVVIVDRG